MIIYLVTNKKNDLKYVGQTIQILEKRKKAHIHKANSGSTYYFHRALKKYGLKNFSWEILKETNNIDELNKLEVFYINKYDTFLGEGYNLTKGGRGCLGWKHSYETKQKLRKIALEKKLGKFKTEKHKKNIGKARKGKGYVEVFGEEKTKLLLEEKRKNYISRYGKEKAEKIKRKQSENNKSSLDEVKKKMSKSHKRKLDKNGKRINITKNGRKKMSKTKIKGKNPNYVNIDNGKIKLIVNEYLNNNKKITKDFAHKFKISIYLMRRILKEEGVYERKK